MSATWRIVEGECMERLAEMPDASVQCVVTSPPYWGLRDYGTSGQLGLEPTPEAYVERMVAVFREVRRVLRDDGTVWLNLGDSYAANRGDGASSVGPKQATNVGANLGRLVVPFGLKPKDLVGIPWRVAFALQADGWFLRSDIIWAKPNPMPESVTDRPTKAHEYLFLLTKSARYYYDAAAVKEEASWTRENNPDWQKQRAETNAKKGAGNRNAADGGFSQWSADQGRNLRSVWNIATHPFPGAHFATFPPKLVEPCVKAGTPERGCCPECGSPWVRQVERAREWLTGSGGPSLANGHGADGRSDRRANLTTTTTGWQPSCTHDVEPIPSVVMDPFAGSGTTGMVALRLGRSFVGIELNPTYADMARSRIADDAPLFNVPAEEHGLNHVRRQG